MRLSALVPAALVGSLMAVAACSPARPSGDGFVDVRNLSAHPVEIEVTQPTFGFWNQTSTYQVTPWRPGMCFAHFGLNDGPVWIRVISEGRAPAGRDAHVQRGGIVHIAVEIGPSGSIVFADQLPSDPMPCQGPG